MATFVDTPASTTAPGTAVRPATTMSTTSSAASASSSPPSSITDVTSCVERLALRERIALLVWPGVTAPQWDASVAVVEQHRLGGIVLLSAPPDVANAVARLDAANPRGLVVSVDEEGGTVQRLRSIGVLPSARAMVASHSPAEARAIVAAHAAAIGAVGIDMVLGPVVDVDPVGGEGPLGSRLFSDDAAVVTEYARAYVEGWRDGGLVPVLKHFPGHGSASADSHDGAASTPPLEELETHDLVPYRSLAALQPAVMVGHLSVPDLTTPGSLPASMNPAAITELLRGRLGYADALVLTDALEMGAVRAVASLTEAAVLSLAAGADVVLFSGAANAPAVIDAVAAAIDDGRLTFEALTASARRVTRLYPDVARFCATA